MYRIRVFENIVFEGDSWKPGMTQPTRVDYTSGSSGTISIDGSIYEIPSGETVYIYGNVAHLPKSARSSDDD